MKDEALNRLLSEVEQETKEHPILAKLKMYKWILYCYIFNNNLKVNTMKKLKVFFAKVELFTLSIAFCAISHLSVRTSYCGITPFSFGVYISGAVS